MIKLVIFDLDGTLYDYDSCNKLAENQLYKMIKEKFNLDRESAARFLADSKIIVKKALGNVAASHNRLLYMQKFCEMIGINPCEHAMSLYELYWNIVLENMNLYEYVLPVFKYLRQNNIKIALLTDLTALVQYKKIDALQIGKYIDVLTTSEEVGEEKPSPKTFELTLTKSGVRPNEALMIGDSKVRDIVGAKKVGLHTYQYKKQVNAEDEIIGLLQML